MKNETDITNENEKESLREKEECATQPMTPDWWNDLYTDGCGNCYSDADSGL
jgi:hypothetical protein